VINPWNPIQNNPQVRFQKPFIFTCDLTPLPNNHPPPNSQVHWSHTKPSSYCPYRLRKLSQHPSTLHSPPPPPTITPSPLLFVMVGNGAFIQCQGICPTVDISLQTSTFSIPFYLLHIEGADVILGIEWLRTLGPIKVDFSIPSIAFTHYNQQITLQATIQSTPTPTTYHQSCHYLSTISIASFHLISIDFARPSPYQLHNHLQNPLSPLAILPFPIRSILIKHQKCFPSTPWLVTTKTS